MLDSPKLPTTPPGLERFAQELGFSIETVTSSRKRENENDILGCLETIYSQADDTVWLDAMVAALTGGRSARRHHRYTSATGFPFHAPCHPILRAKSLICAMATCVLQQKSQICTPGLYSETCSFGKPSYQADHCFSAFQAIRALTFHRHQLLATGPVWCVT